MNATRPLTTGLLTLFFGAVLFGLNPSARSQAAEASMTEKASATATEVSDKVQDASKAAMSEVETLWQRIDERRLKNRTPDELVAWALMGLLVGGLFYRFSDLGQVKTILLGLIGAFVGGILANVLQLNFGLGPVLIRYEDLLFSLVGGLLLFLLGKWYRARKHAKVHAK